MDESEKIYFREEQRFNQKLLWIILFIISTLFTVGFIKQILFKVPFGDKPMPNFELTIIWIISSIIIPSLLYIIRLITIVKNDGVYFRFNLLNFSFSKILFVNVRKYEARTYSPIIEYGGWGIRDGGDNGKAYNVSGNKGIQFEISGGKRILIGTQKPEEFIKAINEAMANNAKAWFIKLKKLKSEFAKRRIILINKITFSKLKCKYNFRSINKNELRLKNINSFLFIYFYDNL